MIPVPRPNPENEPPDFEANCRAPGITWMATCPEKDPHEQSAWWSQFRPALAAHFSHRCGWQATWIGQQGIVEHWLSCGHRKGTPSPHRHLAFEWTNYRYATGVVNSLKGTLDDQILDPCEVKEGWFEVRLPDFQLVATNMVPAALRAKAELTLEKLQLRRHFNARWTRWDWYRRYWNNGTPDLNNLRRDAPLVAAAVEKRIAENRPLPDPTEHEPADIITPRLRRYAKRTRRGQQNA